MKRVIILAFFPILALFIAASSGILSVILSAVGVLAIIGILILVAVGEDYEENH
jgi:hypothetical protein